MKKCLLSLFLIIMCFSFIPRISAVKKCYYKAVEGYYRDRDWKKGGISACNDNECSHTGGLYHNFYANTTIPSTYDANTPIRFNITFTGWKSDSGGDKDISWTNVEPSYGTCHDCSNWNAPISDVSQTTGQFYVGDPASCPPFIAFRTGVSGNNQLRAYLAQDQTEANSYIDWMLRNHLPDGWSGQSFFFVAILNDQSKDEDKDDDSVNSKYNSCVDFTNESNGETGCTTNPYFSCMWVKKHGVSYCNFDNLTYVKCGDAWDLPDKLPSITSFIINFIKIVTPIILVFVSILSLLKAVASSKEDEMKKAQSTLVRRIIAAVIVFFIIQITQFVVLKVADSNDTDNISTCLSCMINNNDCSKNRYYKTQKGGQYYCTYLNNLNNHDNPCN